MKHGENCVPQKRVVYIYIYMCMCIYIYICIYNTCIYNIYCRTHMLQVPHTCGFARCEHILDRCPSTKPAGVSYLDPGNKKPQHRCLLPGGRTRTRRPGSPCSWHPWQLCPWQGRSGSGWHPETRTNGGIPTKRSNILRGRNQWPW